MRDRPTRGEPAVVRALLIILALSLPVLILLGCANGEVVTFTLAEVGRGSLAMLGWGEALPDNRQLVFELLLRRALVACGVGGALAFSGALLQGVFRNGLASPAVLGVTSGASLGAALAILVVGGYGGGMELLERVAKDAPMLVTCGAFAGAMGVTLLVAAIGGAGGRVSVPTLLLVGIAVNACIGGLLTAVQAWLVEHDWQTAEAVFHWGFGSLKDKGWSQVAIVWAAAAVAAAAIPFVAQELDLFASGEEDAAALGVDTVRVKLLVLIAASLAAAAAVAVAGQIAFVGLVVPHLLRPLAGSSHRVLLPFCLLGGAVFLLGTDVGQRLLLGRDLFKPGVLMSMVGGPFFLVLLLRRRHEVRTW